MRLSSVFVVVGLGASLPAFADTYCNANLLAQNNALIQSFTGYGWDQQNACYDAMQQCQGQLDYLHSQGRNPYARCEVAYSQPQPRPQPVQTYVDVACSSVGHRYQTCPVPAMGLITAVQMLAQYSNAPCIDGSTFGVNSSYNTQVVWTNLGCRGLFRVYLQGQMNPYPPNPQPYPQPRPQPRPRPQPQPYPQPGDGPITPYPPNPGNGPIFPFPGNGPIRPFGLDNDASISE